MEAGSCDEVHAGLELPMVLLTEPPSSGFIVGYCHAQFERGVEEGREEGTECLTVYSLFGLCQGYTLINLS